MREHSAFCLFVRNLIAKLTSSEEDELDNDVNWQADDK